MPAGAARRRRSCAAAPPAPTAGACSDDDWEKCRGGAVVDVVAEGWGQGHARASALGVAGMMATLAAAANGAGRACRGRTWSTSLHGVAATPPRRRSPRRRRAGRRRRCRAPLPREAAEVILSGLSYSHRAGTARTRLRAGVRRAALPRHRLARRQDRHAELSERRPAARRARAALPRRRARRAERKRGACSSLRPYKWYVAA